MRATEARTRADFHAAAGVLLVTRAPPPPPPPAPGQPAAVPGNPAEGVEILLALWDDGSATALHGHVDLGTGLRTALAQLAAEELGLPLERIHMLMGSTAAAPNQGATIASASIQIHAAPLRAAAAQAAAWLKAQGASSWPEALAGRHVELTLDLTTPLKPQAEHQIVGQSVPRLDIPAKAFGEAAFVHDLRVPGMLHGRVLRPPYVGVDAGDFVGNSLIAVDEASIAHIPGIRAVVVIRDFVGLVAEREEHAEQALRELQVQWKPWPGIDGLDDLAGAIKANPATRRVLLEQGDVDAALAAAPQVLQRRYVWPYQLHASIGPSCAVAHWQQEGESAQLVVWAGTQNPHVLRADLARLTGLADVAIDVQRLEAAGCYGRNGADDVAADAALLSRAVGAPVRVQLTREQEHAWEPKGAAQLMDVRGALGAGGALAAYDFETSYPSNGAPTLALLLTGTVPATAQAYAMGDRTSVPPYAYDTLRAVAHDMPPILRASWLRGVSALPNSFAHESFIDELASLAGEDPVQFRLRHLKDVRAAELLAHTAQRAGWRPHSAPQQQGSHQDEQGDWLRGQGVAYARYVHSRFPGFGAAFAAWVADVEVNRATGDVHVSRIVVGHDAGLMVNPAGVQQQIHGNVLQTTSRALKEQLPLQPSGAVAAREWGSYPILNFREVPVVEVLLMPRPGESPLGAGESASVPGTAAIANAIFDATGVRLREPPFTPEVMLAALNPPAAGAAAAPGPAPAPAPAPPAPAAARWPRRGGGLWARAGGLALGLAGLAAGLLGWRPAIAPVQASAAVYTPATLERGRQLAALGNCAACHTAEGGAVNAGGRPIETPFGTVHSTNLTPDAATGIGLWSFSAFQRAMREGISRDGHRLYPAFPYTSFQRASDDELQALYAHLMSQPAVAAAPPPAQMRFPFNLRALLAGWQGLYGAPVLTPAADRSAQWQRGEALVNGLGHCGACHSPRDAFGAEVTGPAHLSGALVNGWEAPALTHRSSAPVPWTEEALFQYLREGHSPQHGAAAGPMATVVRNLQQVPADDVRAMAHYLASFSDARDATARAQVALAAAAQQATVLRGPAQRLFEAACGACHHDGAGPATQGLNIPLALNSSLHSAQPHNLLRAILHGLPDPVDPQRGHMPAFKHALDDAQVAALAAYMRQRFAPAQPAWQGLQTAAAGLRHARD